ncbi:MAG TPA: hypothetical protein VNV35_08310 [Puia sp.]|jgi:hypothetical protein|nr:hypothetical protein [Puia sp.]
MEKAIVKTFAAILIGVSILIITLWDLANYIWNEEAKCCPQSIPVRQKKFAFCEL